MCVSFLIRAWVITLKKSLFSQNSFVTLIIHTRCIHLTIRPWLLWIRILTSTYEIFVRTKKVTLCAFFDVLIVGTFMQPNKGGWTWWFLFTWKSVNKVIVVKTLWWKVEHLKVWESYFKNCGTNRKRFSSILGWDQQHLNTYWKG